MLVWGALRMRKEISRDKEKEKQALRLYRRGRNSLCASPPPTKIIILAKTKKKTTHRVAFILIYLKELYKKSF